MFSERNLKHFYSYLFSSSMRKHACLTFHSEEDASQLGLTNKLAKGLVSQHGDDGISWSQGESQVDGGFLDAVILPLLNCGANWYTNKS